MPNIEGAHLGKLSGMREPPKRQRGRPTNASRIGEPQTTWIEDAVNLVGVQVVSDGSSLPPLDEALDPVLFVEKYLRMELWSKQKEMLRAIVAHPKVAVKSAHQMGKTFIMASMVPYWLFTRRPAYVFTTAPTSRQVRDLLWREIRRLWGRLPDYMRSQGECLNEAINMRYPGRKDFNPMHGAIGKATDEPKNLQGEHKENFLVIVDEANEVPEPLLNMIETWGADHQAMIGNPVIPHGSYYECFGDEVRDVFTITINGLESPNFSGEECSDELRKRLLSQDTVDRWARKHGINSAWYRSRALAEFPTSDESRVVVPTIWFREALRRNPEECPIDLNLARVGVDVSDSGEDSTCIAIQSCNRVIAIITYEGACKTDQVMEWVRTAVSDYCGDFNRVEVFIDKTGVGAGVANLMELETTERVRYRGVHFAQSPNDKEQFSGWRAEAYWAIRDAFNPSVQTSYNISFENADDMRESLNALEAQLGEIRYSYDRRARIVIESKEQMRRRLSQSADGNKRLGSPDEADALALALCPIPHDLVDEQLVTTEDFLDGVNFERLGVAPQSGFYTSVPSSLGVSGLES